MLGAVVTAVARRPLVAHEHTFAGRSRARTLGYRYVIGRRARRILCVSEFVAASLIAEGVRPELLAVVPNGVPAGAALTREAAREQLGLDARTPAIGMVGRLRPEKRHDLALEAFSLLRRQGSSAILVLVGDGPMRPELEWQATRLGVAEHVRWTGERPNAGTLMRAFDVVVLCSEYEGMPLAALEALVAGVPVVATAVGGLPELLGGGVGALVPPGSATALAEALAPILADGRSDDDPQHRRALEDARARYTLERVVRDYERVYAAVLGTGADAVR
jgi:glycosyltransferase involved in cell wall biosynthesis